MAAGRGQFFRSLYEGLERKRVLQVSGGQQPGPGRGWTSGRRGKRRQPRAAAPSPCSGGDRSWPEPDTEEQRAADVTTGPTARQENVLERLPLEVLIKILSYLDASSLFCISFVSKLFNQLANDDVMWHKIYTVEFGSHTWKPKSADDAVLKVGPVEAVDHSPEDQSPGRWKKMYLKTMAGQEMDKWRRELRDISPYTGLPRQTEWVLRNLSVSWELTVCGYNGRKCTLEHSQAYFFESSVILHWSGGSFPKYHNMSSIQLYGVRKEKQASPKDRKPSWRSLISRLDLRDQSGRFFGRDGLIKLMHLSPGFIIGIWRGTSTVAFVMVSLHFNKLVEKCLLGSLGCPYSEPMDLLPLDTLDPDFGLHGFTLHFVLHNTSTQIMSGQFSQLFCCRAQISRGFVELKVIHRTNVSQHRTLSGNIKLPWKIEELEGSVENCCIMTLTLLDVFQRPFWCVSSPICIRKSKKMVSFDYGGEHFWMDYRDGEGQVNMKLVWLKEQKQFFLISLILYVLVSKVNKMFGTSYP